MSAITVLGLVYVLVIGLVVGSFLNVVIVRLHQGEQFTKGRSHCDHCKRELRAWELIPLFSWIALRGRCATCKRHVSAQHPVIELGTALLFGALYWYIRPDTALSVIQLMLWLYVAGSFVVLFVYDLRWYLLPDKVLIPIVAPALLLVASYALETHSWRVAVGPLAAAVLFGGSFLGLAVVSKGRWMGGGDIKLAAVMGLLLGLQKTAFAMLVAFNVAAIVMVPLLAAGRLKPRSHIPFGPFLIAGTLLALFFGEPIIRWYITLNGLA